MGENFLVSKIVRILAVKLHLGDVPIVVVKKFPDLLDMKQKKIVVLRAVTQSCVMLVWVGEYVLKLL